MTKPTKTSQNKLSGYWWRKKKIHWRIKPNGEKINQINQTLPDNIGTGKRRKEGKTLWKSAAVSSIINQYWRDDLPFDLYGNIVMMMMGGYRYCSATFIIYDFSLFLFFLLTSLSFFLSLFTVLLVLQISMRQQKSVSAYFVSFTFHSSLIWNISTAGMGPHHQLYRFCPNISSGTNSVRSLTGNTSLLIRLLLKSKVKRKDQVKRTKISERN